MPTSFPSELPQILVDVYFFHALEDPSDLQYAEGYAQSDLIRTIGRFRRVSRGFQRIVDGTFAIWKRRLGVDADGFYHIMPVATLYDLLACTWNICYFCGMPARAATSAASKAMTPTVLSVNSESSSVRDVDVFCCHRCDARHLSTREERAQYAFTDCWAETRFYCNTSKPPTYFERFSGVCHSMILSRNTLFLKYLEDTEKEKNRASTERRLIQDARRKDLRKAITRYFGKQSQRYKFMHEFAMHLTLNVTVHGHVNPMYARAMAATAVVLDHFVSSFGPLHGFTWQSGMLVNRVASWAERLSNLELRPFLTELKEFGSRTVLCNVRACKFLYGKTRGRINLFTRRYRTMVAWVELRTVRKTTDTHPQSAPIDCVVQGKFLHEVLDEELVPELKEATVDARVLAKEYSDIYVFSDTKDEVESFEQAIKKNCAFHEARILKRLQSPNQHVNLNDSFSVIPSFKNALNHTVDWDLEVIKRIFSTNQGVLLRKMSRGGFPKYYGTRSEMTINSLV